MSRADKTLWRSLLVCGAVLVEVELLVLTSSALARAVEVDTPQAKADMYQAPTGRYQAQAARNEIDSHDQILEPTPASEVMPSPGPQDGPESPPPQRDAIPRRPMRPQAQANVDAPPREAARLNASQIKIFTLKEADAGDMAELLRNLFGDGSMRFAADRRSNSVVVIATREQLVVAESVISQIDDRPARPPVKSVSKETAVRVKEGVPGADVNPTEKALRRGNLQIQKLSNPDGLIIRSTDGNFAIEEVAKVLGDLRPGAHAAKESAPQVPDGLIATIRRQNQELKELRALVESLHPGSEKRVEHVDKAIEPIRPTEEPIK